MTIVPLGIDPPIICWPIDISDIDDTFLLLPIQFLVKIGPTFITFDPDVTNAIVSTLQSLLLVNAG